ncbi:MAG TPA: MaoC family dehydratase N-terminal domain-containing protein [Mycobacteriales bacterium]|nr:MaoC family dehydratase N-terminal domain-containing protein [Mycobacteriales bacterium]
MALDPGFEGRVYPPGPVYEVGREKIREFADAIGDANPVYRDPAAAAGLGYRDVIAPPTFAFVPAYAASAQVIDDPALGLDFSRVVHADQRFVYTRPIHAGDRLLTTVTIERIRAAAGNDLLTTRSDLATEAGEPVVTAYMTLLARGTAG